MILQLHRIPVGVLGAKLFLNIHGKNPFVIKIIEFKSLMFSVRVKYCPVVEIDLSVYA